MEGEWIPKAKVCQISKNTVHTRKLGNLGYHFIQVGVIVNKRHDNSIHVF